MEEAGELSFFVCLGFFLGGVPKFPGCGIGNPEACIKAEAEQ